jgi:hypothetical protein
MAKTRETVDIEQKLMRSLRKTGTFLCIEVTIGIGGSERVDLLSWDTDGTWRAYEIKVTKADFRSKNSKSFVGNLNYFALPAALYEQVKDEIPEGVGVWCEGAVMRRPTRRETTVSDDVLMASMMRSCYRDAEQYQKCEEAGTSQWDEKIRKMREKHQKTVSMLRKTLEGCRPDYERRDALMDYWRKRAQRLEAELRSIVRGKAE